MRLRNKSLILLKPSTFMNLSGNAVRYWMQKEKIETEHLLVVVDDLALPFGTLRLKPKGSAAGHNGLKHIQELIGENYPRLRFGIGNDFPKGSQINHVLEEFSDEEKQQLPQRIETAVDIIRSFCLAGIDVTMNMYNNR
jgi:PTH1 family peptidyl-tRNA hydrolase